MAVLIPSVELDNVQEESATVALIQPISPADGQDKFPLDGDIVFMLLDPSAVLGTPIDTSGIVITLNGGAPGIVIETNPDFATAVMTVTPPAPLTSDALVTVSVTFLGETLAWSFKAEDTTPPELVEAFGTGVNRIRVVWDDEVKAENAADPDDALNPSNYTVSRTQAPTTSVEVVSVETTTELNAVELVLDIPTTFGAQYRLNVANVVDECGNEVVLDAGDKILFTAFAPEFPAGRRFLLWEMIPLLNRCEDTTDDLKKFVASCQEIVNCLLYEIDSFANILDPDTAPEDVLDRMICDLGRPSFVERCGELDVQQKRALINVLIDIYKLKGTATGIVQVIRFFLGLEVTVKPYNDPDAYWELGIDELGSDGTDGSAILGPTGADIFKFDVCTTVELTDEQRTCISEIVEYMRHSREEFARLIEPGDTTFVVDHWELGLSELGSDGTDGTALLH